MPIDSLITLSALYRQKRLKILDVAHLIQKEPPSATRTLEKLLEAGLVQRHGTSRNRSYTLSSNVYRALGSDIAYTRQTGFDQIQQEEMIMQYVREYGSITRGQAAELCILEPKNASRLLSRIAEKKRLRMLGQRRTSHYVLPEDE